ncbi:MAG: ATP-binding protein, partial [Gemmatimonadota bacterium]
NAADLAAIKDAEQRLQESEERFRFLVEKSRQVFFYVHDTEHRFVYLSPSVKTVLGYAPGELLGKRYDVLLEDTSIEAVQRETAVGFAHMENQTPSVYLARVRHKDGTPRVLELVERGVLRNGHLPSMQGFARDVTERVRAAEFNAFLARASRILGASLDYDRTLRAIARLAVPTMADWCVVDVIRDGDAIARIAARHAVRTMQPTVKKLMQYPPDMDVEEGVPKVLRTGESVRTSHVDPAAVADAAQDEGHRAVLEHLGVRSAMIVPLRCRRHTLGALTFVTSHSERHYTEAEQAAAEKLGEMAGTAMEHARLHREAHEAIWARQDVLTFVSHDLKNPLNVVLNATSLIEETATDPERVAKYSGLISRAALQMRDLVTDLLTASRMEAGRFWVDPEPTDPAEMVEAAVELLRSVAEERGIELRLDVPERIEAVSADARRVQQVLQNLIGNAMEITSGGGEVRVAVAAEDGHVRFRVSDDGPGITEEDRARIFEAFYQGGDEKQAGWGLGLAITRGIVEAHGGSLDVDSVEGHGSTFSFTLPVAGSMVARDAEAPIEEGRARLQR